MVKVDVISGFLGAGKTTLIKKMFESDISKEQVVIIENEFGEIGIDGTFLKEAGVQIREINSGCICCSLVGDFESSIKEVINKFNPDRIIIEPSGVGKLSDIVKAILKVDAPLELNIVVTVVDGGKCKMYIKNFGEFYIDQVKEAHNIVISKTDKLSEEKVRLALEQIKEINPNCSVIATPIIELDGEKLVETLEGGSNLDSFIENLKLDYEHHHDDEDEECCCHHHHHHDEECEEGEHHHHHHDDDDDEECCHHHHHDEDDDDEDEHEHHHGKCCHHHDEDEEEHEHHHGCCHHDHEHEHEHDEDDHECCHHHDHEEGHHHHHHHEGHHHADEVFSSWGTETIKSYSKEELSSILDKLCGDEFGVILRSKGVVKASDVEEWYYFDLVYGDYDIRLGAPDVIGKVCVIGSKIDEQAIQKLF